MTVTATEPQAKAPARTAGARGAKPAPPAPPAAPRPRRQIALTPMRSDTAKSLRKLAVHVQGSHPDMSVHAHLRDAARVLESGNEEGAQRHLRAAMFALTPQSLLRNGVHDDPGHLAAREAMHGVHRHLLLVKDIQDAGEKNRAAIAKHAGEDMTTSPPPPAYGGDPGALAQKPVARQPGGDRALNAPARTNSGGSDPAVADPVGPQPRGSKQFTSWDEVCAVIELTAPQQAPVVTWDDLASVVELSARTAQLEVTPAPYGKPGGPGLYHVKGLKHSDYLEQIVHALMTKRGMGKGQATAIARGAIRKWSRGGGKVHPEVRAAAAGAEAEELKAQARAHAHAATWDDIGKVIEMTAAPTWDDVASVIEMAAAAAVPGQQIAAGQPAAAAAVSPAKSANATAQPRVAAGAPAGGQFAPAGSGGGGGKQPMDAHQQHVAHLQHLATHGTPAQQQAAKTLLGRMSAGSGKTAASKPAAPKTTVKAPATVPATAKSTAKTTPKTTAKTIAKTTTSKASTGTTAKSTSKAAASKAASTTAKATAHQQHTAHVAHLQHLATHGNPAQQKAAKAVLARMGVKP